MSLAICAPKVNLFFHVLGKTSGGWHECETLCVFPQSVLVENQPLDLLSVEPQDCRESRDHQIKLQGMFSGHVDVHNNSLVSVLHFLDQRHLLSRKYSVVLDKRIPVGAGLGGGSSNAAMLLKMLMDWEGFDFAAIQKDLLFLGSDVPVCFEQSIAYVEGIGEKIFLLSAFPQCFIFLTTPPVIVLTKDVFSGNITFSVSRKKDFSEEFQNLHDLKKFLRDCGNDLEISAVQHCPVIADMLVCLHGMCEGFSSEILKIGMSGSGPTCFVLCTGQSVAAAIEQGIKQKYPQNWSHVLGIKQIKRAASP